MLEYKGIDFHLADCISTFDLYFQKKEGIIMEETVKSENEYVARDFMEKFVFSVPPEVTVHELIRIFVSHNMSAIPVVDEDNHLIGIVSEGDLLYKKVRPHIPRHLDVLGGTIYYCGYGRYEKSFKKILATKASDLMTEKTRCVTPDTPMSTITSLMIDEHLKTVPVVDEEKHLVGMITRHDILTVLAINERNEFAESEDEETD